MRLHHLPGLMAYHSPADDPVTPPVETPPPEVPPPVETPPVEPVVTAPPAPDWRDKRIAELTAKLNAERAKLPPVPVQTPGESPEAFQARVDEAANAKAIEIAAVADWNSRCNAVAEQGKKEFVDFDSRLASAKSVVNLQDPVEVAQFNGLISAAMETGEAHKLLHSLGETPGEVKRLMSLSPLKMAMEVAARAAKLGAGPPAEEPSGAPKPIEPIGSRGNHYDGLDPATTNGTKLPIGQWMKLREAQAEKAGIQ